MVPVELEAARLLLRPVRSDDAAIWFQILRDQRLFTYIPQEPFQSVEEAERRIQRVLRGPGVSAEYWLNWTTLAKAPDGAPVGIVEATVTGGDHARIAYFVAGDKWGHGYGREAVAIVANWLLSQGIKTIIAEIDTRNTRSQRLVECVGFKKVSETRDADFFKGEWSSEATWALTKTAG